MVYCASSSQIDQHYFDAAAQLGELLALNGIICINGAGKHGLMGALNDSVLRNGGKVKGVIPRFMADAGLGHDHLTETIITETIHERKAAMAYQSNAAVALPGGVGTLEELAEIITWKQLGLYVNPIVILNIDGFYDALLAQLEKAVEENFMRAIHADIWKVATTPAEAMELLLSTPKWDKNIRKFAAI